MVSNSKNKTRIKLASNKLCKMLHQIYLDGAIFLLEDTAGLHYTCRRWDIDLRDWVAYFKIKDAKTFALARLKYGI